MTGPLRVRMGLHTCEAELRDGDYYGSAVNRAARLMSVAHGGQVVVSAATSELVRGGSVELVDLGEHRLRDLGEPERVFQIAHPELVREFPALQSVDELPGNLPLQPNRFVGRAGVDRADHRAGRRHRGGDAHRSGRRGQDAARIAGRRGAPARVPRRGLVHRPGAGEHGRSGRRGVVGDVGLQAGRGRGRRHRPVRAVAAAATCCWWSTTASTWSRASRRSWTRSRPARPTCG